MDSASAAKAMDSAAIATDSAAIATDSAAKAMEVEAAESHAATAALSAASPSAVVAADDLAADGLAADSSDRADRADGLAEVEWVIEADQMQLLKQNWTPVGGNPHSQFRNVLNFADDNIKIGSYDYPAEVSVTSAVDSGQFVQIVVYDGGCSECCEEEVYRFQLQRSKITGKVQLSIESDVMCRCENSAGTAVRCDGSSGIAVLTADAPVPAPMLALGPIHSSSTAVAGTRALSLPNEYAESQDLNENYTEDHKATEDRVDGHVDTYAGTTTEAYNGGEAGNTDSDADNDGDNDGDGNDDDDDDDDDDEEMAGDEKCRDVTCRGVT
jgi:hypothetical protein